MLVIKEEEETFFSCGSTTMASNQAHTNTNRDCNTVMTADTSISDHIVNNV